MATLELQGIVEVSQLDATLPGPLGSRCVLVSSWESSRSFPRTRAGAVPFDLTTDDGQKRHVEPAGAAAHVNVQVREPVATGYRETGFIRVGERITIRGDLDESTTPPTVIATLIAQAEERPCGIAPHRLPPGALTMASPEPVPRPARQAPSSQQVIVAEPPAMTETPPPEIIAPPSTSAVFSAGDGQKDSPSTVPQPEPRPRPTEPAPDRDNVPEPRDGADSRRNRRRR